MAAIYYRKGEVIVKLSKSMIKEMVREALDTKYEQDLNEIAGIASGAGAAAQAQRGSDTEYSLDSLFRSIEALADVVNALDERVKDLEARIQS